jgi:anaerobic magnesium-protoporphyrin IX monomethyl ester cyclase
MAEQLDLLIVHPGAAHGIYGVLGDKLVAVEPPLWARLIAGYVRDRGHTVRIIDAEAMGWSPQEVANRVHTLNPRLCVLAVYGHQPSASTQQMTGAHATATAIKSRGPTPVMMVGGHVSALPERTMREERLINYIGVGEGPVTIERLLAIKGLPTLDDLRAVPGLGFRANHDVDSVHINPAPPLIEDLAQLHGDVWDLLPMSRYRAHNWQCFGEASRQPYASVYTSLGCPYKCAFCCINAPFASNRYRMRKPSDVVLEISRLHDAYGVKTFKIIDEMFVLNERHYNAIAQGIIDAKIGDLNIWAYARVDTVKPENLALLRKAGIKWLALGVESGSAYVRDGAMKKMRNDDIAGVVRAIQAADINVIANYIFGLPDDDFITMGETFSLACDLNTEFANFYSAMAYPGSALYAEALKTGATLPETWRGYSQHNDDCRPLDTKHLTGADVLKFRDDAFRAYFSRPRYKKMIADKFGDEAVEHVEEMLKYTLHRKLLEQKEVA